MGDSSNCAGGIPVRPMMMDNGVPWVVELPRDRLFIPPFYYQMTPKVPLNTRYSISISKNLSINGRTRSSDQLGIWSYNINP